MTLIGCLLVGLFVSVCGHAAHNALMFGGYFSDASIASMIAGGISAIVVMHGLRSLG